MNNNKDWQNDEALEQLRYKECDELNAQLLPCPFCGGKATISFCVWYCCGAKAREIECDCGILTDPDIEKWNSRTCEYWQYLGNGEIEIVELSGKTDASIVKEKLIEKI